MRWTAALVLGAAGWLAAQSVPFERLVNSAKEPGNWLTYSGGYNGWRYSPLNQITPANVKDLSLQWVFQSRIAEKFEVTPLVVDGVMYLSEATSNVYAIDAATGRLFWEYRNTTPAAPRTCCGILNRGVAILDDRIFVGTVDAWLLAIDARTGRLLWRTQVGDYNKAYAVVHAPMVVKDKVVVGPAGGEFGIRGFVAAYEAKTGKELWRFNTVPGPGEAGNETWAGESWKTGGAPIWTSGSYDPELNLIYWGTGNPAPSHNGDSRAGDNLYSGSVIALDADTGKLRWHYQFTPHDEWDWDAAQIPVLADLEWRGRPRKLMLWANRNGFYYVLDRATGQFLQAKAFVKQTWNGGFDERGRPVKLPNTSPTREGTLIYPGQQGATNWYSPSYSPRTGLFYVPAWVDYFSRYYKLDAEYVPGSAYIGGTQSSNTGGSSRDTKLIDTRVDGGYGAVRALDAKTGEMKWEFKLGDITDGGILTTAGDVLFTGNRTQYFYGLDARTGDMLWRMYLGGNIRSGPMSYLVNGKQHIAVAAGTSLFVFAAK